MQPIINLCTATLPAFNLFECLTLARDSNYSGIELRIHEKYHVSLQKLIHHRDQVRKIVDKHDLHLSVYNTYHGINDDSAVETLIGICRRTGVKHFRVVLPVAGEASVSRQAKEGAVIPSYKQYSPPKEILKSVREKLLILERKCKAAGVTALLEIHWGTVMSSFSSAHFLLENIDPSAVAITLDPANMVIEGKEDWEYGVSLLSDYLKNLHVKNSSWERQGGDWQWRWDDLKSGMVDWAEIFRLLDKINYKGMIAMEDFCVPTEYDPALKHLSNLRSELDFYRTINRETEVA